MFVRSAVFQPKLNDAQKTYKNHQNPVKSYCFLGYFQSLFNFGGKVNSVRQSDNSYQITKIQKRETTSRIILNVYTFYYQHLKDSELYEIAKEDLNLSKRQLDLVKQRFDLGAVSKTDYLKATVRYGSAKSTLLTRELSFNNSFKNLRNSMGLIGTDMLCSDDISVEARTCASRS